jgi:glucose-6-phosphate isomerase
MLPITLDYANLAPDVTKAMVKNWQDQIDLAHRKVAKGGGLGSDFLGWVDPEKMVPDQQLAEIQGLADQIREQSDALVVIGIGGSYLGARAVIEALGTGDGPAVFFAGNNLSAHHHQQVLEMVRNERFSINVVSKSGTTTEPAVAFRIFRELLETNVGKEEAKHRIVATTDNSRGALRKFADTEGYATLPIADDVGGRYSVLSPVGLLPIAAAGIDIVALRQGAIDCSAACGNPDVSSNPAVFYAAARNLLYRMGYNIEIFASFEPRLHFLAEWWKQLFGESEGKDHISLFPASVDFTSDLHSMGQWIQQGRRSITETFVIIDGGEPSVTIPEGGNEDELAYLAGKELSEVNMAAYRATSMAHRDGGVPNLTVRLPELSAYSLGALIYFFERACGVSGYLMGVNPFDQPGVEAYKKNMFALLEKPGFEEATKLVEAKAAAMPKDANVHFPLQAS